MLKFRFTKLRAPLDRPPTERYLGSRQNLKNAVDDRLGLIQRALGFGQTLAGADFSPSDAAALGADLIACFKKEPAKQMEAYEAFAKMLQQAPPFRTASAPGCQWPCVATTCGSRTAKTSRLFGSSRATLLAG